jgi:hypothetical protein
MSYNDIGGGENGFSELGSPSTVQQVRCSRSLENPEKITNKY